MTIEELIKKLGQCDKNLRVVIQGYEGGYDDVSDLKTLNLVLNVNKQEYLGHHEEASQENTGEQALLLISNRR